MEQDASGSGVCYYSGDAFVQGAKTYTAAATYTFSLYGTGDAETAEVVIGTVATNRSSTMAGTNTLISLNGAANATGKITTFEFWLDVAGTDVKIGTFTGSGTDYTRHDQEVLGAAAAGHQRFTGLDCAVTIGDFIGFHASNACGLRYDASGGAGIYYKSGDQFNAGKQTYTLLSNLLPSLYGTGELISGWANIAKVNGVPSADIMTINGIAKASIAKVDNIAV
jgi:hypothetical protein